MIGDYKMSDQFNQHFKATSGFDAGNEKIINVATADKSVKTDAVNVDFFITHNGVQQYDAKRGYEKYHTVIYQNRPYYAKQDIENPAGQFNVDLWQALRTDPKWDYLAKAGNTALKSGDYVAADGQFANIMFSMPNNPVEGDTITVKDIGGRCGFNEMSFLVTNHKIFHNGKEYDKKWFCTTPYSMNYFIFVRDKWHVYQTGTEPRGVYAEPNVDGLQVQNGDQIYRRSALGEITLILPKFANHGDVIETFDVDELTPIHHVTIKVHESVHDEHSVGKAGTKELVGRRGGHGVFIFDADEKLWRLWDGDQATRMSLITEDATLMPNTYVAVYGDQAKHNNVTLTLPESIEIGDRIQISLMYMYGTQTCKIVTSGQDIKILMNKNMLQFPKRSEYPPLVNWEGVQSLEFKADKDYIPYIELSYVESQDGQDKHWMICHAHPLVERVDPTRKARLGVIALGTQDEVNKNREDSPSDEVAVTPKTLANKTANETRRGIARIATQDETHQNTGSDFLDSVIVTPKKLNECVATEERRGVLEIATQDEVNAGEDDTRAITPKKLETRRATEDLAGIAKLVKAGGHASTTREATDGTGIYDKLDHKKVVTPKNLSEMKATETSMGLGFLATQEEIEGATLETPQDSLLVTASTLVKRVATEDRTGLAEIATQEETNLGEDDTRIITPKKLHDRHATETLHGLAEIATQEEFDAGLDDTRISTPLKVKTFFEDAQRLKVDPEQGLNMVGDLWAGITISGLDAEETTKGVAKLATAQQVDAGEDDTTIVTPAKLHGKKATEEKEGVIKVATQAETVAGESDNTAVSPKNLKHVVQVEDTWKATETQRGFVTVSTKENCFVGDNLQGSTQEIDQYPHEGVSVSPRGLSYALNNYLPKMATAQDSLKLGGVVADNWIRRDIDQTVKGTLSLEKGLNVNGLLDCKSQGRFETLLVAKQETDKISSSLVLGQKGVDGNAGITLHGTDTDNGVENSWSMVVGGKGTNQTIGESSIAFGALNDNGEFDQASLTIERNGNVTSHGNMIAGNSVHIKSGSLYIGSDKSALSYDNGILNVGHGNVNIKADVELTAQVGQDKYKIVHKGNADTVLKGMFIKSSGDTMAGKLIMDNAPIVSVHHEASAETAPSAGNAGMWNMRVTTPEMVASYPEKRKGTLMQWGSHEDGLTQIWSPDSTHKHYIRSGSDGQWTVWGEIYTKQNRPTAQEIGAVVADGGLMNSMTVRDWIKVGNVKIIANRITRTVDFVWED